MKKVISLLLCALVICAAFSACKSDPPAESNFLKDPLAEDSSQNDSPSEEPFRKNSSGENSPSSRPLRLFVDQWAGYLGTISWKTEEEVVEEFLEKVRQQGGPTDIEVKLMPSRAEERQTELNRIRVEMMAGGGPDVFISTSLYLGANWNNQALFQFPEQAMRRGMFLKLDEYIENAQFMEWEKLNPVVMDAGKIESGQYLLPLAYVFPLTYFLADDVDPYPATTTWADMAAGDDPALGAFMETSLDWNGWTYFYGTNYLSYTWKNLADYDSGKLLISEEDLLQRAKEALALKENNQTDFPHFRETISRILFNPSWQLLDGNEDLAGMYQGFTYTDNVTMIPLYCDEGGAVVPVRAYAGINAATERPEDAFFLLDVLLSEDCQGKSWLFEGWEGGSMPVSDEITGLMMPGILKGYREARSQITSARIVSPLDFSISYAMYQYQELLDSGEATEEALTELLSDAYREMKQMLDES